MPVWQKAHQLSIEIFKITANLPRSEDYGLTSQIRRSSNSVPANIAEGFGRFHPALAGHTVLSAESGFSL